MRIDLIRSLTGRYLVSIGICVIGVAIWQLLSAAQPPSNIYGSYIGVGCPSTTNSNSCVPAKATDHVSIVRGKNADATVSVRIAFDKGQSCTLQGKAAWSNDSLTLTAEAFDSIKPCQLVLHFKGSELSLEDQGLLCREVYCGTRGTFDGNVLERNHRISSTNMFSSEFCRAVMIQSGSY